MKLKHAISILVFLPVLFLAVSCTSTPDSPPPAETPPEKAAETPPPAGPAKPDQASLDALDVLIEEIEDLRRLAEAIESPSYFPDDWAGAETLYGTAKGKTGRDTADAVRDAHAAYIAAGQAYQSLVDKTLPLYAKACEDEILAARGAALAAGIEELGPDFLLQADKTVLMAQESYDEKNYFPAINYIQEAVRMYVGLQTGCDSYRIRQEIIDYDLLRYDPDNFRQADWVFLMAIETYERGDIREAQEHIDEAHLRYNLVYTTGWQSYAAEKKTTASDEQQRALEAKADVAVRDEYNNAFRLYGQADASYQADDYPGAGKLYIQAEEAFSDARQHALEKRRLAEEAIQAAEEKVSDSEDKAKNAETIIEGGSR